MKSTGGAIWISVRYGTVSIAIKWVFSFPRIFANSSIKSGGLKLLRLLNLEVMSTSV